ncbi:hypothetical protein [Pseudoduganella namucuonensis]|uniref:Uncharacterized protein n=1 Tax=Pseudoduganella namucuonensis TaxID=1035707 RepID=A0A1I7LW64_9BURK|nr:hypothetical protein [Pseudoduganella namucuonensis]SFV13944.1 hypothetical protein SAMN05216552_104051 [Pseudoduganella namucuonensis]
MKQHDMTPLPPRAAPIAAEATAPSTAPAAATSSLAAGVAAIDAAAPSGAGAGGADMLISEPKGGLPMPQGAAMRKAALDLLYENARERPGAAGRDKVEAGHEPAPPAGRLWRERRLGRLFPPVPESEPEELILESGAADWLLVVPVGATEPGHIAPVGPGKGRKSGGGGGGGRAAPPGAWFGEDAPGEGGDRLHRVAVVADTFIEPLRPPKMDRPGSLPALRPKSKAECERRCGSDGFCDPSAPLGCGGVHCGRRHDILD